MDTNRLLMEKMKKRRAAMEVTMMSEPSMFQSDGESSMRRTSPGISVQDADEIPTLGETSQMGTVVESLVEDVDNGENDEGMLEDLHARRRQRQEELNQSLGVTEKTSSGAWGDGTSAPQTQQGLQPSSRLAQSLEVTSSGKQNLNASIRERLRSKVKAGAQSRSSDSSEVPERKLKGLRGRALPTRFDDAGLIPEAPAEEEEQMDLERSSRWLKMVTLAKQKPEGMPTDEECYNFFTGTMDIDDADATAPPTAESATAEVDGIEEEMEDDEAYFGGPLVFWERPPYVSQQKQLDLENELYFVPSIFAAPAHEKTPHGGDPRYLEDEGFYVGKPPPVTLSSLHIMENRLLKEKNFLWFGEDGQIKRLPDPLRPNPSRPLFLGHEEMDPELETEWKKIPLTLFDNRFIDASGEGRERYQLDVDISTLSFSHHPLFSREHVLESKIKQMYSQFCQRVNKATSKHLDDKLVALKMALQQCEEAARVQSKGKNKSQAIESDFGNRIKEYKYQIRQTRKLKDSEDFTDRSLLKSILSCWHDIKRLREKQSYCNTSVKVVIRRELIENKEEEERMFEEELQEELQERREEYEEENEERHARYQTKLKEWKRQQKIKKRKERERRERFRDGEQTSLMEDQTQDDIGSPPVPPAEFDEAAVLEELRENARNCRRRPGEALLFPELQFSGNITRKQDCPREEQLRRQEVQNWKACVRVLFNDREVSKSASLPMSSDFSIHFGIIQSIRIVQWPDSIKLQILEVTGFQSRLLSTVFVGIPELSMVSGKVELEALDFSSDVQVTPRHEGVGSGVVFTIGIKEFINEEPMLSLFTTGVLCASASWGVGEDGRALAPPLSTGQSEYTASSMKKHDALAALGAAGMVDVEKLAKWISESQLDPNDPANADIMNLMKAMTAGGMSSGPQYFRLNQLEEETQFVTREELDRSRRFKLIQLRNEGVPEFKNYKMIPLLDRDIPANAFEVYEKRVRGEIEEEMAEDEMGTHRAAVNKFLNKLRQEISARSMVAKRQKELKDMIIEDEVPDIGTIGVRIGELLAPRRPLKPKRKERKKIAVQNVTAVSDVKILVNIVRAFDIPVRQDTTRPSGHARGGATFSGQPSIPEGFEPQVRPFIEVMFQGEFTRTSVADGPNPNWNEQLKLSFRAPNNDYSTDSLQTVTDVIYLNVFDEKVFDITEDARQRGTNIHQRLEKHWLGSIEVPFSTVYFNNKVEGTFRVNTPAVLLGYQHYRGVQGGVDMGLGAKDETFLTLYVTIEPPLQPGQPLAEKFESDEDPKLLHNAQLWLQQLRSKFPTREFRALVTDLTGKKVFITRYIKAQNPPAQLVPDPTNKSQQVMETLARYVSLIPYISDSVNFPDLCDIWATSDQFLRMLTGDEEEHAVLLCNYFHWMGKRAYVVMGEGIPEGATAYVLCVENSEHKLWNPMSGEHFDVHDANCPLRSIGCILNHENIWANVQPAEQPYRLSFDLTKTNLWRPFFNKSFPNPGLGSVQRDVLDYQPTDPQFVTNLQDRIEKHLRDKIMSWRPRFVTSWNRFCSQAFRDLLRQMEHSTGAQRTADSHKAQLEQILSSYKLSGFPLQMAFSDMQPIVDTVYSTGVHTNEDPDVEFALAVHVHPYPNSVLSVWVYVGSLRRKTSY